LTETQNPDGTWDEPYFTGTGFPGYGVGNKPKRLPKSGERGYQGLEMPAGFMINYHLYRNLWPLLALGRYRRALAAPATHGDQVSHAAGARALAIITEVRDQK
jgi:squalene cyclase